MGEKAKISAKELVRDIRSGVDDNGIMQKYNVSAEVLQRLFRRLVDAGALKQNEMDQRYQKPRAVFAKPLKPNDTVRSKAVAGGRSYRADPATRMNRPGVSSAGDNRKLTKQPFAQQAATACLLAPIMCGVMNVITARASQDSPVAAFAISIICVVIIIAGTVLGIIALFGIRNHGTKGILVKAVAGLSISGLILLIALGAFFNARNAEALFSSDPEQQMQEARDALLKYEGWVGIHVYGTASIVAVSINDRSKYGQALNNLCEENISFMQINIINPPDHPPIMFENAQVRFQLDDGSVEEAIDLKKALHAMKKDRRGFLAQYSGPHRIDPGTQFSNGFVFVPFGFDWERVVSMDIVIDGAYLTIEGKLLTPQEKHDVFNA